MLFVDYDSVDKCCRGGGPRGHLGFIVSQRFKEEKGRQGLGARMGTKGRSQWDCLLQPPLPSVHVYSRAGLPGLEKFKRPNLFLKRSNPFKSKKAKI